jgi:hypothetical protein
MFRSNNPQNYYVFLVVTVNIALIALICTGKVSESGLYEQRVRA